MGNIKSFMTVLCILVLSSCATKKDVGNGSIDNLLDNKWQVVELSGETIKNEVNGRVPFLYFDKSINHYSVITGCNTLNGEYSGLKKDKIKFGLGMSTMMFCDDMSVENGFKSILSKITSYKIEGTDLFLMNKKEVLAKLKKYNATFLSTLVGTSWQLDYLADTDVPFTELFPEAKPTLVFQTDNKLTGNASCNTYNSSFTVKGASINIGDIISTRMMCSSLKGEKLYIDMLSKVNTFSQNGDVLTLIIGDIAVMRFKKI